MVKACTFPTRGRRRMREFRGERRDQLIIWYPTLDRAGDMFAQALHGVASSGPRTLRLRGRRLRGAHHQTPRNRLLTPHPLPA
jgi:hypothetical protein